MAFLKVLPVIPAAFLACVVLIATLRPGLRSELEADEHSGDGIINLSDSQSHVRRARVAMLASRLNTLLSIPMLFLMVAQSHNTTWFVVVA